MAFSSTVEGRFTIGDRMCVYGTYTNGAGDTGGDVATGLSRVDVFLLQPRGSAQQDSQSVANESFPFSGGGVTIVTGNNEDGVWFAIGE